MEAFQKEIVILKYDFFSLTLFALIVPSHVESPNIVKIFGATVTPRVAVVMEFCADGTLYDYLQSNSLMVHLLQ